MLAEPILATARLTRALDAVAAPYVVGGSLASSIYGEPRATNDVDVIADLRSSQIDPFVTALGDEFYVDRDMVSEAVSRRASFNVIHQPTVFKLDVFVPALDAWTRSELARGIDIELASSGGLVKLRFASAEDTLLHKLVWYRLGGEISERQWRDVLGILRVRGRALDADYLTEWAAPLGVADLLARSRADLGA